MCPSSSFCNNGETSSSVSCWELPPASSIAGGDYSISPPAQSLQPIWQRGRLTRHVVLRSTFDCYSALGQQLLLSCLPKTTSSPLSVSHSGPKDHTAGESSTSCSHMHMFKSIIMWTVASNFGLFHSQS